MNLFGSKTKFGAFLIVAGVAIYQTVDLCPVTAWVPWIKWAGSIVTIVGTYFGIIGIGGKVDKNTEAVKQGTVATTINTEECKETPMTAVEFRKILEDIRRTREAKKT